MKLLRDFIQLFAVQTTLLNSEGNDLSPEMKTYYDKNLLRNAKANLVHRQFGQKRPLPKGSGKTIEFRKFTPLGKALTPLTEGVTPSGNQLDVTSLTATVSQYGDFIQLSDLLELTALDPIIVETTALLGDQAGRTDDTLIRDVLCQGTNVMYAPTWSGTTESAVTSRSKLDTTAVLTVDLVKQVAAKMRAANVPTINGNYVAIIHPLAAYDLESDPAWIDMQKYQAREELFNGEIGRIAGVRFVESSEAKIWRGDDLASDSRTLAVNGNISAGAVTSISFDGGTVAEHALKGRKVYVGDYTFEVTDNTASALTVKSVTTTAQIADNTVIYPGEGGKQGISVFATLFLGRDAYGVTDLEGGGLQTIVKQKGSAGTGDPLDQRSSVGWKLTTVSEILMQPYLIRVEHTSKRFSANAAAN